MVLASVNTVCELTYGCTLVRNGELFEMGAPIFDH